MPIAFELLGDHLADLRERHERSTDVGISIRRRWPLSVRSRYPSASFLVRPILSSSSFACLTSRTAHFFRHSGPGLYGEDSSGATEPGVPTPSQNDSLSWSRSTPSASAWRKSLVPQPLGDLRIGAEALVGLPGGVRAVGGRVEADRVVALLLVLQEDRQLAHADVALLRVVLAGDGAEVEHFEVLGQRHLDLVQVRKLVPLGVDGVEERVPLQHQVGVLIGEVGLPGAEDRQIDVEPPVDLELEVADPVVEARRPWPCSSSLAGPAYFGWNCFR